MLVNRKTTYAICPHCGFKVEVRHHSQAACEIKRRVAELRGSGMTGAQVGRELGISRERVRQICLKMGREKAIETIAANVVARSRQLGNELVLSDVIELLKNPK
jgi:orotate phosphoribosyltransferase-like protein